MEELTKICGISYEMITKWLCDQENPFKSIPLRNEDGMILTLDRVLQVTVPEDAFVQQFGHPLKVTREGNVYRAQYKFNSPEDLQRIGGALKILDGKVIEDTYISYLDKLQD